MTTLSPVLELERRPIIEAPTELIREVQDGLRSRPRSLKPWMFYDEAGSRLFEQITALPEYYPTRTERDIFTAHAAEIFSLVASTNNQQPTTNSSPITIVELGAGTASKTGILLRALTRIQP